VQRLRSVMSVSPANYTRSAAKPSSALGTSKKASEPRPHTVSLLQRPTEKSVAFEQGTSTHLSKGPIKPKELTFKQQLLKKSIKESKLRPCGVMALHIKHGHFHDIDSGGKVISSPVLDVLTGIE